MNIQNEAPIRALAIAPYESMAVSLVHAAEAYPDIHLEVHTGDLEQGIEIVNRLDPADFDVIISRGGTAEMIRSVTDLPVVEISVSIYDVLRAIKLSESYTDRFAIAGFPAVTKNAHILCSLLGLNVPIRTVSDAEGARLALDLLEEQGIHTVICDKVTHSLARERGLTALLITSGEDSLRQALQQAKAQGSSFRRTRNENLFLRNVLIQDSRQCIIYNEKKEMVFAFPDHPGDDLISFTRRRISGIQENSETLVYHQDGNLMHAITASVFHIQGQRYSLFRVRSSHIPLSRHAGIQSYDEAECEQRLLNSFFNISGSLAPLKQQLDSMIAAEKPVMILGEEGTGREQIARYLYLHSRFRQRPFIMIDGIQLGPKGWNYLMENLSSPLAAKDVTVFFQHLEEIPPQYQQELLSIIEDTGLSRRLWLIFSCSEREGHPLPEFIRRLSVRFGPMVLHLPPLRSRRDEIPALSGAYLNSLNEELGKQLAGFEPEAMDMLVRHDWPGNYSQFKNVLQELAVLSAGPYITTQDTAELLARERRIHRRSLASQDGFAFAGQTLDEIVRTVAQQALNANGGNQSLTARQLGISRTTLWRMLSPAETAKKE